MPLEVWLLLTDTGGGLCMARTRNGDWCRRPLFAKPPELAAHHEHRITVSAEDWERWLDGVCPVHRRGRWLDASRALRAAVSEKGGTR
jgi:hypothetical protein